MKLLILITLISCGYAAKLDRTYLPPARAASAGGTSGSLLTPASGFIGQAPLDSSSAFGRQSAGQAGFGMPSYDQRSSGQSGQNGFQSRGQPSAAINQPSGAYIPPSGRGIGQFTGSGPNQVSYNVQAYNQPQRAQAAAEQGAQILRYDNENDGETFSYSFETSNGIRAEETGIAANGISAQGGFGYTGDDGQDYSVTYTADENGYQPEGEHLPTPHPIPEEILKSIEENARAADAGTQEGAYRPEEYGDEENSQTFNSARSSFDRPGQGLSRLYEAAGRGSQGQRSFGQTTGGSQGQTRGFNQGKDQSSFGESGSNERPAFAKQGGANQSGYEYNPPQGSVKFGSQSSGPQGSATSYSRPSSEPSQRSFEPSPKGSKLSYIAPSQPEQSSQYRPGQSSFGSGPSSSSPFGRASTSPQGQFGPTSGHPSARQGRPDTFSGLRQPPSFSAQEGYKY